MLDILLLPLAAGMIVALLSAPLGCAVVWQRIAYFGDSLAHSALLGIALGLMTGIPQFGGIVIVAVLFSLLLVVLQQGRKLSADTSMAILAHSSFAFGVIALALTSRKNAGDLHSYLFGDILFITTPELWFMAAGALCVILTLLMVWKKLISTIVHEELAFVDGIRTGALKFVFILLMAVFVALSLHVVGILLLTSLLIIPAATARYFSTTPEGMVCTAWAFGSLSVALGIFASVQADIPTTPAIVAAATLFFALSTLLHKLLRRRAA